MNELPAGWRPGPYTAEDLVSLGLTEEAIAPAAAVAEEWRAYADDPTPTGALSGAVGHGIITAGGAGRRLPGGLLALVVVSFPPAHFWPEASDAPRWILPPGLPESDPPACDAWAAGALETAPGVTVLFARIWHKGALFPCLTLRTTEGAPAIALEGLGELRRLADADELTKHVRLLKQLVASGRPSLEDSGVNWRERALRSFEMQRETPRPTLTVMAEKLCTSKPTLCRWRAMLRRAGTVPN